jgi:hypothetical protein
MDAPMRRSATVPFPGTPTDEDFVCAVLITRHPITGEYHYFTRAGSQFEPVPPAIGAMLALEAEIANT